MMGKVGFKIYDKDRYNVVEERYIAQLGNNEEIEITYYHDYTEANNLIEIMWKTQRIPQSLLKVFKKHMKNKTKRETVREVRKFIKMMGLNKHYEEGWFYSFKVKHDKAYGGQIRMLMRLFLLASDIEELIALIFLAFIMTRCPHSLLIERYLVLDEDLEFPSIVHRSKSFIQAVIIFNNIFGKSLERLREKYIRTYEKGVYPNVEIKPVLAREECYRRHSSRIVAYYNDGHLNFYIVVEEMLLPMRQREVMIECLESDYVEIIFIEPGSEQRLIHLLSNMDSVKDAETFMRMLHFVAIAKKKEEFLKPPYVKLQNMKHVIQDYINSFETCYGYVKDEKWLGDALKDQLKRWREIFGFINRYGDDILKRQYLLKIAEIAVKMQCRDVFKQIYQALSEEDRNALKLKFLSS